MWRSEKYKVIGLVAVGLVLSAGGVWNWTSEIRQARADDVRDPQLKKLLTERLAILKDVVSLTDKLYRAARASYDQVKTETQAMYQAELDLCETDKERVQVLEKMLTDAREKEEEAAALQSTARGQSTDVLKSRADRLNVEIALYRARAQ